jgi:hypothetical protein
MKATEIVDKLKSVLLSAEEPQVEPAAEEQVELNAEEVEVNDAVELNEGEEMPEEEAPAQEEMEYVSKQEFESAIAEMKAMYAAIVEKMGSEEQQMEVPEELSKEEEKVDLSADEPAAEPIAHAPEVDSAPKPSFFSGVKPRNTMSVVYEKMFNK